MLLSALARFLVARSFDVPWIAPDEMIYGLVGQSLWETGTLAIRESTVPYYSLLTPALVGLPLTAGDLASGVASAQALQALAMSLVAVPVYLFGARLTGARWALGAAAISVLPPALWYGGLLMTEALFYPLVATALLALARMLEQPTLERQGVFLLAVSIAAAVRLQALILLPALLVAVALYAWFGRSGAIVRRLAPILALVGLATAALMAVALSGRSDLLGAYGEITQTTGASSGAVAQFAWHAGVVVAMTLGLPLLATTTLVVLAMVRGEEDPAARAFLAVTAAYVVLLVAQVSLFAVEYLDHVSERYVITALPLLVLGLCLWISRAGPRPAVIAVPVTVAAIAALLVLPESRVGTTSGAHDALTLLPLGSLAGEGDAVFRGGLLALGLVFAAVFLLTPRRFLAATAVAVALGFVAALRPRGSRDRPPVAPGAHQRLRHVRPRLGRPGRRCARSPARHGRAALDLDRPPRVLEQVDPGPATPRRRSGTGAAAATRHDPLRRRIRGRRGRGGQRAARPVARDACSRRRAARLLPADRHRPGLRVVASRRPLAAGLAYRGLYAGRRLRAREGRRLPVWPRGARAHVAREGREPRPPRRQRVPLANGRS